MTKYIDFDSINKYYDNKLVKIKKDKVLSKHNKDLILNYLNDSELGKTIKKGQKRKIGAGRNIQTAGIMMRMCKEWFKNIDLDKVTLKQMEKFISNLDKGIIKSNRNTPYSSEQKSNIKKFIRKFYKHILTGGKHYPDVVEWIDTSKKDTIIEAIPGLKDGIASICELIPDLRRKALLWVCFDSGFREGEIINCLNSDVEKAEDGIYYITCRHSKTKPRTVSLPYTSEILDRWIKKHPKKDDPNQQLWQTSRVMMYKTTKLYSKKALGKSYSVHQIRHTSATFWASKIDRTSFCKRFGWSYSSKTPDRYIDFSKVNEKKIVEIVQTEKYHEVKKELDDYKVKMTEKQNELTQMMQEVQKTLMFMQKKKK